MRQGRGRRFEALRGFVLQGSGERERLKTTMPKVKHIALLKFKEGTTQEQIDQTFDQILELSESIDGIEDYVSGVNNSPEGLNQGYTHGFVMTFKDAAARDAYLPHADHERVKLAVLPSLESVLVFDFEV